MSINSYFLRQSDIMPLKKNTVSNTTEESSRLTSEASTGAGAKANISSFEPAHREVVSEITGNIAQLLQVHLEELDSREKHLTEADAIIWVLEDVTEQVESTLTSFEKKGSRLERVR